MIHDNSAKFKDSSVIILFAMGGFQFNAPLRAQAMTGTWYTLQHAKHFHKGTLRGNGVKFRILKVASISTNSLRLLKKKYLLICHVAHRTTSRHINAYDLITAEGWSSVSPEWEG